MASLPGRRERQVKKISVRVRYVLLDKVYSGEFYSWTNLKELRNFIQKKTGILPKKQRLFQHHTELLNNQSTLEDLMNEEEDNASWIVLTLRLDESEGSAPFVKPFMNELKNDPNVNAVVQSINKGFHKGYKPVEVNSGLSGSYFLRDSNKRDLCIFKPYDEEPYAPNNPKQFVGKLGSKGVRSGVLSGEGAAREVAAYLLDSKRIHRVPETFYAEVYHEFFCRSRFEGMIEDDGKVSIQNPAKNILNSGLKYGSMQLLKDNDGT